MGCRWAELAARRWLRAAPLACELEATGGLQVTIRKPGSHENLRVADTRAEILSLIATLRTTVGGGPRSASPDLGAATVRAEQGPPPATPGYGQLVERVHELQRQVRSRSSHSSIPPLVRGLEQRLIRLEERMYAQKPSVRAPEPAAGAAGKESDEGWTFTGVIQGQLLSDMLQLVSSNLMSGLFVVEGDGTCCELYFDEGRMCHAAANGGLEGEKAFFSAFSFEQGKYRFRETKDLPEARTIKSSTQFLILEALRQIDEVQNE